MIIKPYFSYFLIFFILFQDNDCSTTKNYAMINISIEVQQVDQELFCNLIFHNNSSTAFYLNKRDIGLRKRITSNVFMIKKDDKDIKYKGILMKRGIATKEDFVFLKSNQSIQTSIRIDNVYKFSKGNNQYSIKYSYYHSSPEKSPKLNKLESDTVLFSFDYQ